MPKSSKTKSKPASIDSYEGYCVKCKEKRAFEGTISPTANGGRVAKGPCPECKTTICRMLGKKG